MVAGSSHARSATLFHIGRNKNRKKELIIIQISKQECTELQKLGHKFGSDRTLHIHGRKRHTYYMTESKRAMTDLEKIRQSHIIEKY